MFKKKICFTGTIPAVINSFMKEYIKESAKLGKAWIISKPVNSEILHDSGAKFVPMEIERKVSLWKDILALTNLIKIFRREHFDLVHSIMPKTGLITMFAGWLTGIPNRIHTFTGQVWANKNGFKRLALKFFDKLVVFFATQILVDSPSQQEFLISEGILKPGQSRVIGNGSICGVNPAKFHPDKKVREKVRKELNISESAPLILFVGRLNRDKGMLDLAKAFKKVCEECPEAILLLVGSEEDVPYEQIQEICQKFQKQLRRITFTPEPERYMAAADIFCLPSYREGFGQTIIEAGASEVPTAASRIYGVTDAVEDGVTGILFPPGDIELLKKALIELIKNESKRKQIGKAARNRAISLFSSKIITKEIVDLYAKLLMN
jgi:glycosyltransferase involved in cell wall biosynthesis